MKFAKAVIYFFLTVLYGAAVASAWWAAALWGNSSSGLANNGIALWLLAGIVTFPLLVALGFAIWDILDE